MILNFFCEFHDREAMEQPHVVLVNRLAAVANPLRVPSRAGGQRGFPRDGDGPRVFPRDRENRDGVCPMRASLPRSGSDERGVPGRGPRVSGPTAGS